MRHEIVTLSDGWSGTDQTVRKIQQLIEDSIKDPVVVIAAQNVVRFVPERDKDAEIEAISQFVRSKIRYTNEGIETLKTPRVLLDEIERFGRAVGDCDDAVILWGALHRAIGSKVRAVVVSQRPDKLGNHIYAEVFSPTRGWVSDDTIVKRKPLGWEVPENELTNKKRYELSGLGETRMPTHHRRAKGAHHASKVTLIPKVAPTSEVVPAAAGASDDPFASFKAGSDPFPGFSASPFAKSANDDPFKGYKPAADPLHGFVPGGTARTRSRRPWTKNSIHHFGLVVNHPRMIQKSSSKGALTRNEGGGLSGMSDGLGILPSFSPMPPPPPAAFPPPGGMDILSTLSPFVGPVMQVAQQAAALKAAAKSAKESVSAPKKKKGSVAPDAGGGGGYEASEGTGSKLIPYALAGAGVVLLILIMRN